LSQTTMRPAHSADPCIDPAVDVLPDGDIWCNTCTFPALKSPIFRRDVWIQYQLRAHAICTSTNTDVHFIESMGMVTVEGV